jgi:DNA-binding HxlR family transcriptional regulator
MIIAKRRAFAEIPPRVKYSLTKDSEELRKSDAAIDGISAHALLPLLRENLPGVYPRRYAQKI